MRKRFGWLLLPLLLGCVGPALATTNTKEDLSSSQTTAKYSFDGIGASLHLLKMKIDQSDLGVTGVSFTVTCRKGESPFLVVKVGDLKAPVDAAADAKMEMFLSVSANGKTNQLVPHGLLAGHSLGRTQIYAFHLTPADVQVLLTSLYDSGMLLLSGEKSTPELDFNLVFFSSQAPHSDTKRALASMVTTCELLR